MSSKLDRSLDDLASSSERRSGAGRRGGSRGGRSERGGSGSGRRAGSDREGGGGGYHNPLARDDFDDDRSSGPVRRERRTGRDEPYSSRSDSGSWAHDRYEAPPAPVSSIAPGVRLEGGNKVLISNLASVVLAPDIQEIFQNLGTITKAQVHYDSERRSLGTAEVTFADAATATKAVEEYDGAEVDGRPMYVKLIGSVVVAPVPRVVQKRRDRVVAPTQIREAPRANGGFREDRRDREDRGERPARRPRATAGAAGASAPRGGRAARGTGSGGAAPRAARGARGGAGGARGGARGGGRGGKDKREASPDKDSLDKELEAYQSSRGGAAPAAAPAAAAPAAAPAAAGQPAE